ncbi:cell wall-binding repeat-containing protein [Metabacillus niabensis]|uniref:Cell wall-binding protein n=1 Tax=Metabacillus niabensis TaxID=324854 RepID=A0ABT9Z3J5_9BACI|nr:cell wall-binding repeat-containing protein [Metabacillus niabensis]MDQ0226823.1 putative cell wall-binding protein [Metabacillus niabensis]
MKKMFYQLLALIVFLIGAVSLMPTNASAATVKEVEQNNSVSTAMAIQLSNTYTGTVNDQDEYDFFKVSTTDNGFLNINFTANGSGNDNNHYIVTLMDANQTKIMAFRDNDIAKPSMGIKKGTYYIKIEYTGYYDAPTNYSFTTSLTKNATSELEGNNTISLAQTMQIGKKYTGYLTNTDTKDIYKFTMSQDGNLHVNTLIKQTLGTYFLNKFTIQDAKGNIYAEQDIEYDKIKEFNVGLAKGEYYLILENSEWGEFQYKSDAYEITLTSSTSSLYEKEMNDKITAANPLELGKKITGSTSYNGDDDYFAIQLDSQADSITIKGEASDWLTSVSLLDKNGNTLDDKLLETKIELGENLPKGQYYLAVDSSVSNYSDYSFTVYGGTNRLQGSDRYETAVNISKAGWITSNTVVLARGDSFPDALAGGPLAYKENAPILLTHQASLTAKTKAEIIRLNAKKVIILGQTGAVSSKVESQLRQMGINNIERIGGKTRYATAALVAKRLPSDKAIVAYGYNFPDVLSVAPYAAKNGIPILLTDNDGLPAVTKDALTGKTSATIVGGTVVVSDKVKNSLPVATKTRIAGNERWETSSIVSQKLPLGNKRAFIAYGKNFPDALAGSVLAAKMNAPLLLVDQPRIPSAITQVKNNYPAFTILGGTVAVSDAVKEQLMDY